MVVVLASDDRLVMGVVGGDGDVSGGDLGGGDGGGWEVEW